MDGVVGITLLAAMVTLAMIRDRRHRANDIDHAPPTPSVVLSVRPDRTAVVTLDVRSDSSAAAGWLVDEAVRDAFALAGVEHVEVRRSDGELLDQLRRTELN